MAREIRLSDTKVGEPLFDCDWCGKPILCTGHAIESNPEKDYDEQIDEGDYETTDEDLIVHPACHEEIKRGLGQ